jgi:hypothetical protein
MLLPEDGVDDDLALFCHLLATEQDLEQALGGPLLDESSSPLGDSMVG